MSQFGDTSFSGETRAHQGNVYNNTTNSSTNYIGPGQSGLNQNEPHEIHQQNIIDAAAEGQTHRLRMLLQESFERDYKDKHRMTALHHAALFGYEEIADMLIQKGWYVSQWSERFGTPLNVAKTFGRRGVIEVFRRNKGRVLDRPGSLSTPAEMAEALEDSDLLIEFPPATIPISNTTTVPASSGAPGAGRVESTASSTAVAAPVSAHDTTADSASSWPHGAKDVAFDPSNPVVTPPAVVSPMALPASAQEISIHAQTPNTPLGEAAITASAPPSASTSDQARSPGFFGSASQIIGATPLGESQPATPATGPPRGLGLQSPESELDALSLTDSLDRRAPSIAPSDSTEADERRHSSSTAMTSTYSLGQSSPKPGKYTKQSPRLASSIKMNLKDSIGADLRAAAADGKIQMVRALLEKGAPIDNSGVWDGYTALADAAIHGREEVVELLLKEGANAAFNCLSSVRKYGSKENTPLSLAAGQGHMGCVRLLLNWHEYTPDELNRAYKAAQYKNRTEGMRLIQERGGGLS